MKQEISKFKELNSKQKLQYILDYYKIHIIVTAAIICIFLSIASTIIKNKSIDLYVAFINIVTTNELLNSIDDGCDFSISNYTDLLITEDPNGEDFEYAYASSVKLMSAISAGQVDIIIADSYGIGMANNSEYLLDISKYLSNASPQEFNMLEPYFLYDESGRAYAIDLSESEVFRKARYTEPLYLGIVDAYDVAPEVLDYIQALY